MAAGRERTSDIPVKTEAPLLVRGLVRKPEWTSMLLPSYRYICNVQTRPLGCIGGVYHCDVYECSAVQQKNSLSTWKPLGFKSPCGAESCWPETTAHLHSDSKTEAHWLNSFYQEHDPASAHQAMTVQLLSGHFGEIIQRGLFVKKRSHTHKRCQLGKKTSFESFWCFRNWLMSMCWKQKHVIYESWTSLDDLLLPFPIVFLEISQISRLQMACVAINNALGKS